MNSLLVHSSAKPHCQLANGHPQHSQRHRPISMPENKLASRRDFQTIAGGKRSDTTGVL